MFSHLFRYNGIISEFYNIRNCRTIADANKIVDKTYDF